METQAAKKPPSAGPGHGRSETSPELKRGLDEESFNGHPLRRGCGQSLLSVDDAPGSAYAADELCPAAGPQGYSLGDRGNQNNPPKQSEGLAKDGDQIVISAPGLHAVRAKSAKGRHLSILTPLGSQ
jgi:hypothetical protein